jgi:hypothetical protein
MKILVGYIATRSDRSPYKATEEIPKSGWRDIYYRLSVGELPARAALAKKMEILLVRSLISC